MRMDDFAERICVAVEEKLGKGVHTEVKNVRKNNGILLHGLLISLEGQRVVPTVYLEQFLEIYESGIPFEEVVSRLLAVYRESMPKGGIDMNFFRYYEAVKDRICYRLIGRKGNEAMLDEVPHKDFLDMAICFYYAYQGEKLGEASILVYNSHMEMWNVSTADLLAAAEENTSRLFPWKCRMMEDILVDMDEVDVEEPGQEISLKVLSNEKRLYGATCILYPGALEKIAEKEGSFYIIPSSIHEVILLPDDGKKPTKDLKRMIYEVNRTQVVPEEVLSDSLYYYDSHIREIVLL